MSLKILLADDNITAQRMGSKILTDAGHQVITVSNGAAAIKKIASEKPELLILDVYMPGYNGLEVCEKVKNDPATGQMPVILTVTNMEPFNAADGNRVRSDGLMIKPFEATDLLAVVQKFETKSARPAAESYAETQRVPAVEEFKDASYEEWKAEAPEEAEPQKIEMSAEVAAAPALGFDEPMAAPAPAPAFAMEETTAPGFEASPAFDLAPSTEPLPSLESVASIAPPAEFEATSVQVGEVAVTQAAELEVQTSTGDAVVAQDPALVTDPDEMSQFTTTVGETHPDEVPVGTALPGLSVSDDIPTAEISALEEPPLEPPPAMDEFLPPPPPDLGYMQTVKMPALDDPKDEPEHTQRIDVAAAPAEAAVEPLIEERQSGRSTAEMDIQHAVATGTFAAAAAAPALEAEVADLVPEPPPEHPAAPEATIPDHLVAQFAAELEHLHQEREAAGEVEAPHVEEGPVTESIMAPAEDIPASHLDEGRIAAAVNRALDKYKEGLRAELIATIVRELKG